MSKSVLGRIAIAVALVASLTFAGVSAAQAADGQLAMHLGKHHKHHKHHTYPPKTKLTLVADRATVAKGQQVTLTAGNVAKGCRVKFTFGSLSTSTPSSNGTARATFTSPYSHGTITASAHTYGCNYPESAYTTVKATSPACHVGYVKRQKPFHVTLGRFPAGSLIEIRVYNTHFSKTQHVRTDSHGGVSVVFVVPRSGSYLVVASGGGTYSTITFVVH